MGITGRGGLRLQDKWQDGPRTYLGLTTRGFPNLLDLEDRPAILAHFA